MGCSNEIGWLSIRFMLIRQISTMILIKVHIVRKSLLLDLNLRLESLSYYTSLCEMPFKRR